MRKIKIFFKKIIGRDYSDDKLNWYRFEKDCMANDGWTMLHFSKLYKKRRKENIKNLIKGII